MPADDDLHYDFSHLLAVDRPTLLRELAAAHSAIANLAVQSAFLRAEESRGTEGARTRRFETDGLQIAYTEKKWLIKALLDERVAK